MRTKLGDGTELEIRSVEPDDRDALAAGFDRLSPESRYRRFFGPMPKLASRDLDYFTRVDHHDHEALVAVDLKTRDGVGVARYVRTGPDVAEPAMVVADDWQGRGVGSRLLDVLAERAREEGITRFEAPVLATNEEAIHVLERLGHTTRRSAGHEVELVIALPDATPATGRPGPGWGALLKAFALGSVEPARSVLDLLFPRRRGAAGDSRRNVVVLGTDGSGHAERTLAAGTAVAAAFDAAVHVVSAHPFLSPGAPRAASAVQGAAAALRDRGLHVHEHVRRGDPALVITDVAFEERARLIVIGAGTPSQASRRLIGSTADFVAERSPCDVLLVR